MRTLVIFIKLETKNRFLMVAMLSFKDYLNKAACFLKICYHTKAEYPKLSGASVSPASEVYTTSWY